MDKQIYSGQSEYQRIDIFDTPAFGRVLVLDGYLMLTEKDEFIYHEMIVHTPMAVHPNVKDVLVIGAGDGGVVRELAKYPEIERIDLAEIDGDVIEASKKYLPFTACKLDDARLHVYIEDGLKFVRRKKAEYDLIIVDSTDPFGPGEGLFSREFYGNCFKALKEDGIMVNPLFAHLSGTHPHLSFGALAVRVFHKKIPPLARFKRKEVERAASFLPLLHDHAAPRGILSARIRRGDAQRC